MADNESPQIEVSSDEGWKSRVKAEDAALDQQLRPQDESASPAEPSGAAAEARRPPVEKSPPPERFPEATFEMLVGMLTTQAMVALGIVPNPATGKPEKHLPLARYFIDLVDILLQKTSGNLSSQEHHALDDALHSLRMTYIELSKDGG